MPAHIRFLHNVFGVGARAEHSISDAKKSLPMLFENFNAVIAARHIKKKRESLIFDCFDLKKNYLHVNQAAIINRMSVKIPLDKFVNKFFARVFRHSLCIEQLSHVNPFCISS
jgi:hypothetical protein